MLCWIPKHDKAKVPAASRLTDFVRMVYAALHGDVEQFDRNTPYGMERVSMDRLTSHSVKQGALKEAVMSGASLQQVLEWGSHLNIPTAVIYQLYQGVQLKPLHQSLQARS